MTCLFGSAPARTDGIEAALGVARAAAGDKDVGIWGGANIMRQYLRAGLLDEMQIHLIPGDIPASSGSALTGDQHTTYEN